MIANYRKFRENIGTCQIEFSALKSSAFGPANAQREKKICFPYSRTQIQFFFHKLKAESFTHYTLHMCVKFYFSHVCRTHKNFQLFTKLLLKIFCLFGLLKTADIFLSSMKFLHDCHQQTFIYAFFKKMAVKYLFEQKT